MPLVISGSALAAAWQAWTQSPAIKPGTSSLGSPAQGNPLQHQSAADQAISATANKNNNIALTYSTCEAKSHELLNHKAQNLDSALVLRHHLSALHPRSADKFTSTSRQEKGADNSPACPSCNTHDGREPHRDEPGDALHLQRNAAHAQQEECFEMGSSRGGGAQEDLPNPFSRKGLTDHVVAIMVGSSWASGIIVHKSGLVLTAAHAIRDPSSHPHNKSKSSDIHEDKPDQMGSWNVNQHRYR